MILPELQMAERDRCVCGVAALVLLATLLVGSGCSAPGWGSTATPQWIRRSFGAGIISVELPGEANMVSFPGRAYGRVLAKRWVDLTTGSFQISTVEVWQSNEASPSGWPLRGILEELGSSTKGSLLVRRATVHDLKRRSVHRDAVLRVPGRGVTLAIQVATTPDPRGPARDEARFAVDDAIFTRILDSILLEGVAPARTDLGETDKRIR